MSIYLTPSVFAALTSEQQASVRDAFSGGYWGEDSPITYKAPLLVQAVMAGLALSKICENSDVAWDRWVRFGFQDYRLVNTVEGSLGEHWANFTLPSVAGGYRQCWIV